jgi:hypothetical protein
MPYKVIMHNYFHTPPQITLFENNTQRRITKQSMEHLQGLHKCVYATTPLQDCTVIILSTKPTQDPGHTAQHSATISRIGPLWTIPLCDFLCKRLNDNSYALITDKQQPPDDTYVLVHRKDSPELDAAERLHASRSVVRDAIELLAQDGPI